MNVAAVSVTAFAWFAVFDMGLPAWSQIFLTLCAVSLTGFALARETKTKGIDVFKAVVIALMLGIVAGMISSLLWMHAIDFTKVGTAAYASYMYPSLPSHPYSWIGRVTRTDSPALLMPTLGAIGYGFVAVLVLYILRTRFTWLRISPVGMAMFIVLGGGGSDTMMLGMMFVGLALKFVTLKFGGQRFYEEKTRPIATGIFVAYCVTIFLRMILGELHNVWGYGVPM